MSSSIADDSRKTLAAWGRRRKTDKDARDDMVLTALGNGVSREEIHILTGLGRTTIDRIVRATEETEGAWRANEEEAGRR